MIAGWKTRWLTGKRYGGLEKQDGWLENKMADWKTRWLTRKQYGGLEKHAWLESPGSGSQRASEVWAPVWSPPAGSLRKGSRRSAGGPWTQQHGIIQMIANSCDRKREKTQLFIILSFRKCGRKIHCLLFPLALSCFLGAHKSWNMQRWFKSERSQMDSPVVDAGSVARGEDVFFKFTVNI